MTRPSSLRSERGRQPHRRGEDRLKKQKPDAVGEDNDLCKDEPLVAHNPPAPEGESEVTVRPPPLREIKATSASETPPDWGGKRRRTRTKRSPTTTTRAVTKGSQASHATNGRGDQREGRPSDSGTSRGALAYRPAEPAGEPPQHLRRRDLPEEQSSGPRGDPTARPREPVNLRPNKRWRAVYQMQAHMAQLREDPRESGGRSE